jgi:quinol monooxygenase YgiN
MIIIAGTIDFDSTENRDRAVEIGRPLQQATRDDEPGCEAYCFAPDPCVDTRIQVYELWVDEASLAAHFEHENYLNMRTALGQCGITGADNHKYRCDLKEPVYDDTRTPRADFFTEQQERLGGPDGQRTN